MASREELIKQAEAKFQRENLIKLAEEKFQKEQLGPSKETPKSSVGETILEQSASGVPIIGSYLPQMQAAAAKPIYGLLNLATGKNIQPEDYIKERDINIERLKSQQEERPGLSLASSLAGGVVGGAPLAALAAPATALGRIGQAAKVGGAIGLLSKPEDIKGQESGLQLKERLTGGLVGAGAGALGQGILEAPAKIASKLKGAAETQAFKALGPYTREARKEMSKGRVQEIGRELLDDGIIGRVPKSYGTIAERASKRAGEAGEALGSTIKTLSAEAEKAGIKGVDKTGVALAVAKDMINPDETIPGVAQQNKAIWQALNTFVGKENTENLSLQAGENLKKLIGKEIKWDRLPGADIPLMEQVNRSLYFKMREAAESVATSIEDQLPGATKGLFKSQKTKYGLLETASDIAGKREAKEMANRMISPSDYAAGIGGLILGGSFGQTPEEKLQNAAIGAMLGGGNKFLRQYGNQLTAKALDTMSKAINAGDKTAIMQVLKQNPAFTSSVLSSQLPR